MEIELRIALVRIGSRHLALTRLGGVEVKSAPAASPLAAFRNLMHRLSGNGTPDDNAELGVGLLLDGTTLDAEIKRQALPPGPAEAERYEAAWARDRAVAWMRDQPERTYQDYLRETEGETR